MWTIIGGGKDSAEQNNPVNCFARGKNPLPQAMRENPSEIKKAPLRASFIWDRRDSNPRPRDYESPALPLRHSPTVYIQF